MELDLNTGKWMNRPAIAKVTATTLDITTEPSTDLWQRSYYGFRHDNAPALLLESRYNITFSTRAAFNFKGRYDQCGILLYLDSNNWFKSSIEYEDCSFSQLGSVVTNNGYSDWATTDMGSTTTMWYRLSRRGPDFLAETSLDGQNFTQLRIFHMHSLGETTVEMGKTDSPLPPELAVSFGPYACSSLDSSFEARFDSIKPENCLWKAHS